ncbi:hypothetical protein ACFE04_022994 [Oxalis oulophora]
MDFKCYSNKSDASLVASKTHEADLWERVLSLEILIKEMEEENIYVNNEIEDLHKTISKLESDVKQAEDDKNTNISSLERALARVRALDSLIITDLGNDVEPSSDP